MPRNSWPLSARAQQEKLLRDSLAEFSRFCGLLKIPPKSGGERIPFVLSPIQVAYTRARTSRDIILKPRQVYMTTLEAARDIWWFLTRPGARVLMVCQSQGDQGALKDIAYKFRVFFDSLERVGLRIPFGERSSTSWTLPTRDSTMRIVQAGGSEVAAGRKGRGGTVNRLHLTEMAFWGDYASETFSALTSSVPTDGSEVVNESTPNGAGGLYFEQWRAAVEGRSAYAPHFFEWWKHPSYRVAVREPFVHENERERGLLALGVPVEALAWYRNEVRNKAGDERVVSQEFPSDPDSCFLVSGRSLFDSSRVNELLQSARPAARTFIVSRAGVTQESTVAADQVPHQRTVRVWHAPESGRSYVVALDPSEGTGGDYAAGVVLDRGTGRHMATIWGQFRPEELARVGAELAGDYNGAQIVVERNNHGHATLLALQSGYQSIGLPRPYPHVFFDADGKAGWLNIAPSRTLAVDNFEQAVRARHFTTPDRELVREMLTFVVTTSGKAEAARGSHDDLVMVSAIGWDVICRTRTVRDTANVPHR